MKIALVQLPFERISNNNGVYHYKYSIPLGLVMLATILEPTTHIPNIIDLNYYVQTKHLKINSYFFKNAAKKIIKTRPDIVGFSIMGYSCPTAILIAQELKHLTQNIKIVFGGAEACFADIDILTCFSQIDFIVRGEGEKTIRELLDGLEHNCNLKAIDGLTFRKENQIIRNRDRMLIDDLDNLPIPNFKLLPFNKKYINQYKGISIEGGRGCVFQCVFCSTRNVWGQKFRIKSPQRIVSEIVYVKKKYFIKYPIELHHDNFLINRKKTIEFCKLVRKTNIKWGCAARIDRLDSNLIDILGKSGCQGIFIGIETGSKSTMWYIKKNLDLNSVLKKVRLISTNGIALTLSFVIGFPKENYRDLDDTFNLALNCKLQENSDVTIQINRLRIERGSDLYYSQLQNLRLSKQLTTSPYCTKLDEEIQIINKHKRVFPSFRVCKNENINNKTIYKFSLLYDFLINLFPLTTALILKTTNTTPTKLVLRLIKHMEVCGFKKWEKSINKKKVLDRYVPYFEKHIILLAEKKEIIYTPVKAVFSHEKALNKLCFLSKTEIGSDKTKVFAWHAVLKLKKHIELKSFPFDMIYFLETSGDREFKFNNKVTSLMYVATKDESKLLVATELEKTLLSLFDGKRTNKEILELVLQRYDKTKHCSMKKIYSDRIKYLLIESVLERIS
ncbi:MAG: B12-binding domain-containing radical SAM protein [Deltaproteobacteria bacterium]|nr:B12-binding domain-containing radical SAM protein [Deltaproteobacteria bacterium]